MRCDAGYSGAASTIVCASDAAQGAATAGAPTCTENACAAVTLGAGVVAGVSDGCAEGTVLSTRSDSSCTVRCGDGYGANSATMTCASDAAAGEAVGGGLSCVAAACSLPADHASFRSKRAIVEFHEIGSSQLFGRERIFGLYDGDSKAAGAVDGRGKPWHLNYTYWQEEWPRGFPVAKRPQVARVCPDYGELFADGIAQRYTPSGQPQGQDLSTSADARREWRFGLAKCLTDRFGGGCAR